LHEQRTHGLCPRCVLRVTLTDTPDADADDAASEIPSGTRRFGDYELLRELGRGGMGIVYEARQASLNRVVALKMLLPSRLGSPMELERFRLEAEAVAALDHPHILPLYGVGSCQGQPYFTMKLAEGGALAARISDRQFHLAVREAVALLVQIARAVHYAHQRGIQHRDLKPGNILLDGAGRPYVSDFGLAKFRDRHANLTISSTVLGSPAYMAPEQAAGNTKQITTAADVYSLGAILFELLVGRPPFQGATALETMRQVAEQEPPSPRSLDPKIDRDLDTICLTSLSKEPAKRYASAEALAEELERWLGGEPILARAITPLEKFGRWCRRRPAQAALAASVGLALVAVTTVSTVSAVRVSAARRVAVTANQQLTAANERLAATLNELELGRVQQLFASGDSAAALALLGRVLREEPANRVAAEYLLNALLDQNIACPGSPPLAHLREVECARFSHDGRLLATASQDTAAHLWRVPSAEPAGGSLAHAKDLLAMLKPGLAVLQAEFSPDDRWLATACEDGTARLWEVESGRLVAGPLSASGRWKNWNLPASREGSRIEFNPSGTLLAHVADCATNLTLWSVPDGKLCLTLAGHTAGIHAVTFAPGGKLLATASIDGTARFWNPQTGEACGEVMRLPAAVCWVAFSPDGKRLATASRDGAARVWDAPGGRLELTLHHGNLQDVVSARFSPNGTRLLTASSDRTVCLWEVPTGQRLLTLRHDDDVLSAKFNRDGSRIVTASTDNTARVWDAQTGGLLVQPLRHTERVRDAEFGPGGQWLVTASYDRAAKLWDLREGRAQPVRSQLPSQSPLNHAEFSRDEGRFVTASDSGQVRVWDSARGVALTVPMPHPGPVHTARLSPDGKWILTAGRDSTVRLWDAQTGAPVARLRHGKEVVSAWFSPDGKHVATASIDGSARVWEIPSGLELWRTGLTPWALVAKFTPDGRRLLTGGDDRMGRVWDAFTGQEAAFKLPHPGGAVLDADFTRDGCLIVTASADDTARLWDAHTGEPLAPPLQHKRSVVRAVFSPDGGIVATASWDGTACLWNPRTGQLLAKPLQHTDRVVDVAFSADGERVVTASWDGSARVWDTRTGLPLTEPLRHAGRVATAQLSADGTRVLTAAADGVARIWDAPRLTTRPPIWLPLVAESAAGQRLTAQGVTQLLTRGELEAGRRTVLANAETDTATRIAHWFFADRDKRPASPFAPPAIH
jgi:WD40 repeat protein/tRNA A-37 threonylcarbamoyl transferase component Bud32